MNSCDCYILRGDIYLLDYAKSHEGYGDSYGDNYGGGTSESYAGVMAGNAVLQVNLNQNELIKVSRTGLDFTGCAYPDLTGSTIEMSLLCTSMKNLALAFRGSSSTQTSPIVTVTDEVYTAPYDDGFLEGSFIRFANPVDPSTVVLQRSDDSTVLILGTDYTVDSLGFVILSGLPSGVDILADYTSVSKEIISIEAFLEQPKIFKITIVGTNVSADEEERFVYTFKKVRLSAQTNSFDVLNDDFPELTFNGTILRDQLSEFNKSPFLTVEKIA